MSAATIASLRSAAEAQKASAERALQTLATIEATHGDDATLASHDELARLASTVADELGDVMETWRLRTPNKWDPVPWWNEVLTWRGYMYNIIAGAGKSLTEIHPQLLHHGGHQLDQLGLRDRAWGINKLA